MELVDMPGRSTICRIRRLWTSNQKSVGGGFRGPFCASKLGVPQMWVDDLFCMRGGPLREKGPQGHGRVAGEGCRRDKRGRNRPCPPRPRSHSLPRPKRRSGGRVHQRGRDGRGHEGRRWGGVWPGRREGVSPGQGVASTGRALCGRGAAVCNGRRGVAEAVSTSVSKTDVATGGWRWGGEFFFIERATFTHQIRFSPIFEYFLSFFSSFLFSRYSP